MPQQYSQESLSHDPIHGYIPFVAASGVAAEEIAEQHLIDHPWVQRMRQIHQLQTAWWVFPSAEHMRFQHILGAMHLASRCIEKWYPSLVESCEHVPSRAYVESLLRIAALLHDVGHGPFGHFFDDHYLDQFGITHEDVGGVIIEKELGDLISGIRRNPNGQLGKLEQLEPRQVSWLIRRPKGNTVDESQPDWLRKLRSMFSGIYTVDNMDFVLRDAYMSGYNTKAFDISRLIHYSFFTAEGLTIHTRGLPTLINFIETRANLFRTIYFHRTVRALDKALEELFPATMRHLFNGNPLEHLDEYMGLTETTFLVDVLRWKKSSQPELLELGKRWHAILNRQSGWKMACERTVNFHTSNAEKLSIFAFPEQVIQKVRDRLPQDLRTLEMKFDIARHYHRPSRRLPVGGQNFLYDPGFGNPRIISDDELFRQLPVSFLIFRIYTRTHEHDAKINQALNNILDETSDAKTNM